MLVFASPKSNNYLLPRVYFVCTYVCMFCSYRALWGLSRLSRLFVAAYYHHITEGVPLSPT